MAVPLSAVATMGRAILRDVASSAAARVTIHIEPKARRKPRVGLKTGWTASRGVSDSSGGGEVSSGEGVIDVGFLSMSEREDPWLELAIGILEAREVNKCVDMTKMESKPVGMYLQRVLFNESNKQPSACLGA